MKLGKQPETPYDADFRRELTEIKAKAGRVSPEEDLGEMTVKALLDRLEVIRILHGISLEKLDELDSFHKYKDLGCLRQWAYWKKKAAENVGHFGAHAKLLSTEIRRRLISSPSEPCPE